MPSGEQLSSAFSGFEWSKNADVPVTWKFPVDLCWVLLYSGQNVGKVASSECHYLPERIVDTQVKLHPLLEHLRLLGGVVLQGSFLPKSTLLRSILSRTTLGPQEALQSSMWQCFPSSFPIMRLTVVDRIITRASGAVWGKDWDWEVQDHSKSSTNLNCCVWKAESKHFCCLDFKILYLGMWSGRHHGAATSVWPCICTAKAMACPHGILCTAFSDSGDCLCTSRSPHTGCQWHGNII